MSAELRRRQLQADAGHAQAPSFDPLDLFPLLDDFNTQQLFPYTYDNNSATAYPSASVSASAAAPIPTSIPFHLTILPHNLHDPRNPPELNLDLDLWAEPNNQNWAHQSPQGWQPAPADFFYQADAVLPIYNHDVFPEPVFQCTQSSGHCLPGHASLIGVEDGATRESEPAFGYVGEYDGSANPYVGQGIPGPLAAPLVHTNTTTEDESPNVRQTTSVVQPRKKTTKPGKIHGPKPPPILLTTHNKSPIHKQIQGPTGKVQGEFYVFGTKHTQRFKSNQIANGKLAGKLKQKACTRCSKIKKSCFWPKSIYLPCIACMKADPSVHTMPCIRITIPEISLFRLGPPVDNPNHPLNFFKHRKDLWTIVDGVKSVESQILELTQDLGHILKVKVSPFAPIPGDKTAYEWDSTEGPKKMEMPCYHISDIEEAKKQMIDYVQNSHSDYLEALLDSSNNILMDTFYMARCCKKPLVEGALRLWSATRLIERAWRVCGKETLGFEPPLDKSNPWKGIIPVNPIMDQQLDQIVIQHILTPLRNCVLAELHKKLESRKTAKKHWFEIHLTIFVLLSNAETQLMMERQFALRYGMSGRYGPFGKYKDAEDQFHAARTMLSYYHHVCQGSLPLSIPKKDLTEELETEQVEYVIQLRDKVVRQEQVLKGLRNGHQYEKDLYWCHQMFFDKWEPGLGHIEELPRDT